MGSMTEMLWLGDLNIAFEKCEVCGAMLVVSRRRVLARAVLLPLVDILFHGSDWRMELQPT